MRLAFATVALLVFAAAAPAAHQQSPEPSVVVHSFLADVRGAGGPATLAWRAPERLAYRPAPGVDGQPVVAVGGVTFYGLFPPPERGNAEVQRRTYAARPDGYSYVRARFGDPVDVVLARARAGKLQLAKVVLSGRRALRARLGLPPNQCAALPRGTETVWLDRRTLLPLRIDWNRGSRLNETVSLRYRAVNQPVPSSLFRPPELGPRPFRQDWGFVRTTPKRADRRVSYAAKLPGDVPDRFRLAVAGWAPLSGRTGPEASNPRYPQLFAAVYRRGWERIDVTQRLAGRSGWLSDPFGFECGVLFTESANIDGVRSTYGSGPEIVPHLYWRDGRVLHTVSGPLPKAELVKIAESLAPVGS